MTGLAFTLEKYQGVKSRYTCPNCGERREFTRYIDANGNILADDVGKCNRESKCGYHKRPKDFFAENPNTQKTQFRRRKQRNISTIALTTKNRSKSLQSENRHALQTDFISKNFLICSLSNYEQNSLVQFLLSLFPDDLETIQNVIQDYAVGTWKDGETVFWQIDQNGNIRTGKLMRYDVQTGKRQTVRTWSENGESFKLKTDWIHNKIKRDFKLRQCFFGEHLLRKEPGKTIAIVEAEKTALICAICFPKILWLAIGAKGYLTVERLQIFGNQKVVLFPDADAYIDWQEKAVKATRNGLKVSVSSLIETLGTDEEKLNGFDLADYLIQEQRQINEHNKFVDFYNSKLESVLNNERLIKRFEIILEDQKQSLISERFSEIEAECQVTQPENVRKIVLNF